MRARVRAGARVRAVAARRTGRRIGASKFFNGVGLVLHLAGFFHLAQFGQQAGVGFVKVDTHFSRADSTSPALAPPAMFQKKSWHRSGVPLR